MMNPAYAVSTTRLAAEEDLTAGHPEITEISKSKFRYGFIQGLSPREVNSCKGLYYSDIRSQIPLIQKVETGKSVFVFYCTSQQHTDKSH